MPESLTDRIVSLRAKAERARGLRDGIQSRLDGTLRDIKNLESEESLLAMVVTLFQQMIDREVTAGVSAVEKLQTEGLQAVFGDQDLRVKSEVEVQRGKVSVGLITVQKNAQGHEIEGDCSDAFGGAVTTVQSVLLRIIIMMRRGLRPLLVLDESLPAFDHNYVVAMGTFLSVLCSRLGLDILLVSHNPALIEAADRSYRLVRRNGVVKAELSR